MGITINEVYAVLTESFDEGRAAGALEVSAAGAFKRGKADIQREAYGTAAKTAKARKSNEDFLTEAFDSYAEAV